MPQLSLIPALLLLTASAAAARSQEEVEPDSESIVTARKWSEAALEVPASLTVIDGQEIARAGWDEMRDLAKTVPNLHLTQFTSRRLSFPYVRGIGSGQGEPSVITYVDGVPQFGSGGINLTLAGVERVEFLRGPQGALYGRNALGGLINVVTRHPGQSHEPSLGFEAAMGSYERQRLGLSVVGSSKSRIPRTTKHPWWSLDAVFDEREGFTENTVTGEDVDHRRSFFGRGQVILVRDYNNDLRLTLATERSRDGGFALGDLSALKTTPHTISQDFDGVAERDLIAPTLIWSHFGADVDLVSITAVQQWEVLETSDFDFKAADGVRRRTEESQDYVYQELRLSSAETAAGAADEVRWLAGVSGFLSSAERSAANDFRPGGGGLFGPVGINTNSGEFDDYSLGAFAQVTVPASSRVDLTGGLRWDYESKEADLRNTFETGGFTVVDTSTQDEESFDEVMPHFSASLELNEDARVYALASRGFKAGGFNLSAPTPGQLNFGPETSWTFELGAKAELLDSRLRVGAAVFSIDWEDMQLSQFDITSGGYVQNAGESTSQGIEFEALYEASDSLSLSAGLGLLDTEFEEFVDPFGVDVAGNSLPFAPEVTWNLSAVYARDLDLGEAYVRADYSQVGDFHYDAGNVGEESYATADLRLGLRRGKMGLSLDLRNLFDEVYFPIAFQANPFDSAFFVAETGAPRTALVSFTYDS